MTGKLTRYIYVKELIQAGEVKKTLCLSPFINVDLDANSKIVGIEIIQASKAVSSGKLLAE